MTSDPTYLGRVINVDSSNVEVQVSEDIPTCTPVINGRLYKIGQIGAFVKIPVGDLVLYGVVSSVSNVPSKQPEVDMIRPDYGSRYLIIQLVGERLGNLDFEKGVGTYPTINDQVYAVLEEDLKVIYGRAEQTGTIEIGKHVSSESLSVHVDLQHLVLRHSAILGSTGSGKSNAAAHIVGQILSGYPGSRLVLVDPHGEYASAFSGRAQVYRIDDKENPLYIPFWTMTFDEMAFFLVGRKAGGEKPEDKRLREKVLELKKKNAASLLSGAVQEEYITADSPIPFDIRQLWYDFDREVNATYSVADQSDQNQSTEMLEQEGNVRTLTPARFKPYTVGSKTPYKSKNQTMYPYLGKIHSRLIDSRYDFMFNPGPYSGTGTGADIDTLLHSWTDNERRLSILDLSAVPFELIDISVGLIVRLIYDSMYWGRNEDFTGRSRPLLLVFEEAHSYLPKQQESTHVYGYARRAVERIFKEGRKFGVGAMVITQRPSEISEAVLAQTGTFIALRLTNSTDQAQVRAAAPNNMLTLMDLLPSLRIGEAIVVGEAIVIPSRIRMPLVEPRPASSDPRVAECWSKKFKTESDAYKPVVTNWRQQKKRG